MPAISRSEMSDAEIEQVYAYLKSLTTSGALHRHALVRHR
jgi:cytochrome c1